MKYLITKTLQIYANILSICLESLIGTDEFYLFYEQCAMLNAYSIVFHDIYLD
jgi:hypothetical protein